MTDTPYLDKVRTFYGSDRDGFAHVCRVADYHQNHSEWVVALCHDLVEDEYATFDDLVQIGLNCEELNAVVYLTRIKDIQTYREYIQSIIDAATSHKKGGKLALQVKFYDLCDHLNPSLIHQIGSSKVLRYINALQMISLALCQEE